MVAMDFFEASNFYDFFNQYCLNLLKNPTVRGLIKHVSNLYNEAEQTTTTVFRKVTHTHFIPD